MLPVSPSSPFSDILPSAPSDQPEEAALFLLPEEASLHHEQKAAAEEPAVQKNYTVLARKYRPRRFDDLIGQETMVRVLRNAFATGRVAHAFMLTGVRGIGKTTGARILARAFNCIGEDGHGGPTASPCGVCPPCRAILADRHPDVIEMDAASRTGVDDVREIIEATRFRPLEARNKVFIIDEVHMLSRNAFNALLKTLEEPPAHVKFIFATTEIRKVPITVLSRCQRFDLRRVSVGELQALFAKIAVAEGIAVEEEALKIIAKAADGSVRDGLSLLDQAIARRDDQEVKAAQVADMLGLSDRAQIYDLFEAILQGNPALALSLSDLAYANGADPRVMLTDLAGLTHFLSRQKAVNFQEKDFDLPELERTRGKRLAEASSLPWLARLWQMILKGLTEIDTAPDRKSAAEMILIRLCYGALLPEPQEIIRKMEKLTAAGVLPAASSSLSASVIVPVKASVRTSAPGAEFPEAVKVPEEIKNTLPVKPALPDFVPLPQNFAEALHLADRAENPRLVAELRHAELLSFDPPQIVLKAAGKNFKSLAAEFATVLTEVTGTVWSVILNDIGEPVAPSLSVQQKASAEKSLEEAKKHPLVQEITSFFPDAKIIPTQEHQDALQGLSPEEETLLPLSETDSEEADNLPDLL